MSINTTSMTNNRVVSGHEKYDYYKNCKNYEVDNGFVFDLLVRSKYKKYLRFVKNNIKSLDYYYLDKEHVQIRLLNKKLLKKGLSHNIEAFIKDLQIMLGIDIKELMLYYKKENRDKPYRLVNLTTPYNEYGEIEYDRTKGDYVLSLFKPEPFVYLQNTTRPTMRFNRITIPLVEINFELENAEIFEYIKDIKKHHKVDKYKLSLTNALSDTLKSMKKNRQYSKQQHYADILYVYDRVNHGGKKRGDVVYENIAQELTELQKSTKSIFVKKEIKRYNTLVKKMISDLENYLDLRVNIA